MKKLFLLLTAIMATLSANAEYDFEAGGLYFSILSEEERTCGLEYVSSNPYISNAPSVYSGDVVIPETVEHDGKTYTVTEIRGYAFYCCENLNSVKIPNSIKRIAAWAFAVCSSIESIVLPNGLTELGYDPWGYGSTFGNVFVDCTSLKSVNIPTSITKLYSNTFHGCKSLSSIEIPDNVKTIEYGVFSGCSSLTEITIPASVTEIGANPFSFCTALKNINCPGSENFYFENDMLLSRDGLLISALDNSTITIPVSVKTIGARAFAGCNSLTSVNIPDGVTEIDNSAFSDCEKLEAVVIPNSVAEVRDWAFNGCTSLKSVVLPIYINSISDYLFYGCSSLTNIEIPSSVIRIGISSFAGCTSLRSINIPASVIQINVNPFAGCTSLEEFVVEGDNFSFENNCLIGTLDWYGKSVLCALNKEKISVPESVEGIADRAFNCCDKLETVEIPSSVKKIDLDFYGCPNVKAIYLYGRTEDNQYIYFNKSDITTDCKIYVPKLHLQEYKNRYSNIADVFEPFDWYFVGDINYDENENEYSITSIDEDNKTCALVKMNNIKEVYIPESVDGFTVTAIMGRSAQHRTSKLVLPKTIKTICDYALAGGRSLTEVYIFSESMDEYGTEVFRITNALKIYVPENSVEIYKAAWPEAADHIYAMDETMAISSISADKNRSGKTINLAGQPVDENYKGIVIRNGKKVLQK